MPPKTRTKKRMPEQHKLPAEFINCNLADIRSSEPLRFLLQAAGSIMEYNAQSTNAADLEDHLIESNDWFLEQREKLKEFAKEITGRKQQKTPKRSVFVQIRANSEAARKTSQSSSTEFDEQTVIPRLDIQGTSVNPTQNELELLAEALECSTIEDPDAEQLEEQPEQQVVDTLPSEESVATAAITESVATKAKVLDRQIKEEAVSPGGPSASGDAPATDIIPPRDQVKAENTSPIPRANTNLAIPDSVKKKHEHVIRTPNRPSRNEPVQRVIEEQDRIRNTSPLRTAQATRVRPKREKPHLPQDGSKLKQLEAKMLVAARNREQELEGRSERSRKLQYEKQLKVQQNKQRIEEEERKKREEQKKKEQRLEALRKADKVKTPPRSGPASRIQSPARLPKFAHLQGTPKAKVQLFQENGEACTRTPGRLPAKAARIHQLAESESRVATSSSPSREVRRKTAKVKDEPLTPEAMEIDRESKAIALAAARKEAEDERKRRSDLRREQEIQEELARKQAAIEQEKARRERQLREERRRIEQQRLEQAERERCLKEEMERAEAAKRLEKERRLREQEEEEAKRRLQVQDSSQLANKRLLNVSQAQNEDSFRSDASVSQYQMTPPKKFVPPTETNYRIDDLSSGDETDDENCPRKAIPTWASFPHMKVLSRRQHDPTRNLDDWFGIMPNPDELPYFKKARKRDRGSSANWSSPLSNPTKGKSRYLGY